MATTTLELVLYEGMTGLVAQLYPFGSDVASGSVNLTEYTNDKGCYSGSVVDIATGMYGLRVRDGSNVTVAQYVLRHRNVTGLVERAGEHGPDADLIRMLLEADRYIDTGVTPWALVLVERGSGTLGVGRELLRQQLKDTAGNNIGTIDAFVARSVTP
jgi:hypothetical protein